MIYTLDYLEGTSMLKQAMMLNFSGSEDGELLSAIE